MKVCPQCKKTYTDETLNFCLEDGSMLATSETTEPPPTVMVADPRESLRNQPFSTQPLSDDIQTAPAHGIPAARKSRTWIWVIGILMGVGVLCGGGFIGLVVIGSFADADKQDKVRPVARQKNEKKESKGDPSRRLVSEDDFSGWTVNENDFISSERRSNALVLTSKNNYYYIILTNNVKTYDASTRLLVRNVSGDAASSGYGLVINSSPKAVLENDYAFLIRSDNGKYRVVRHVKKKELNIVNWTKSDTIKLGGAVNDLEVRVDGTNMEFYINGEFVKRVVDDTGYKDGIAGIYTSDDTPIAFSKLEIRK